ncbi:MAG: oligosaccharide repeat unit polymerase [Verrucomicrobia bacterium]|nr:oligosaccharide repeat unit polymerase [Verrucomicrobiota bacterium]
MTILGKTMNGYAYIMAFVTLAAIAFTLLAVFGDHLQIFTAVGLWAFAIVLLPPVTIPRYDLFSLWSFVILSVFVGLTVRGFYIAFNFPDPEIIDRLFLMEKTPSFFVFPALVILTGLGAMSGAYLWNPLKNKIRPNHFPIQPKRLYSAVVIILLVSLVSTILYIVFTGGLDSEFISAKRTPIPGLELTGKNYKSYGSLRFLSSLAIFAHLLVLCDLLKNNAQGLRWKIPLALLLFLLACTVPFYASVRSTIVTNFMLSSAVLFYSYKTFPILKFATAGIVLVLAVYFMTLLRSERNDSNAFSKFNPGTQAFNSLILNRNQIELAKTAHIINAIPDKLDYQYGKTIAIWLAAPIPRSLWPDKPLIQPGPIIGNKVYGQKRAGVPPAFIAEMFWNFHLPGVLIGSLLLGIILRFLHDCFRPTREKEKPCSNQIFLYVAAPMMFGYQAISSNLGYALFWLLLNFLIATLILKFIAPAAKPRVT